MISSVRKYGLWGGAAACILILATSSTIDWQALQAAAAGGEPEFTTRDVVLGILRYPLIIVTIILGVRALRRERAPRGISFGEAFKAGAIISAIAAGFVMLAHIIYYSAVAPESLDIMYSMGVATGELQDGELRWFFHPLVHSLFYFFETFVLGLFVSLISGLLFRGRTNAKPATPATT